MQSLDTVVLKQAIEWLEGKDAIWLCTVINTYGSAPRSPGALFAATINGQYVGSLSGGCIEEDFLKRITQSEFQAPSQVIRYGNGGNTPNVNLPCGGSIDVLIEYLPVTQNNITYLNRMLAALEGHKQKIKVIQLSKEAQLAPALESIEQAPVERHGDEITIRLEASTCLLIACLSSVAHYCIDYAHALGFEVIVCEHRDEERRQFEAQTELAKKVKLLNIFPATYLEDNGCHANTAIISLTHDPRIDDLTLMEACNTPAFYIGAMGSKRNSTKRFERLKEVAELDEDQLARIHAPIGLPIGSKTPAEIALAIMADIVKVKNAA